MHSRRWLLLVTVSAALLLITLDNTILYTALPTLTEQLGATAGQSLWIINAYPLVVAGLLLGAGTLGDRIGHRRMFEIGLVVFGVASLVAAFSPTVGVLIAARALLAVGAAAMMPATLALIRIGFTVTRERNLAIAVWGAISVVGMALGPIIAGALLEVFWWGSVFLINVPIVIAALIALPLVAPPNHCDPSRDWDLLSSVLAMLTLSGLVTLIKEVTAAEGSLALILAAAAATVVGGVLFSRRQRRLPQPLLDVEIFRHRALGSGVFAAVLTLFAIAGIQLALTQRYQLVAGFSPLEAGLLVSAIALGSLPTSLGAGALLHMTGLRRPVSGGLAVAAVGALSAALAMPLGIVAMSAALALFGVGLGAVMAVASTAIVGNAPPHRAGMASSVEEVSYEFGGLISVALLGTLLTTVYSLTVTLPAGTPQEASASLPAAIAAADGDPAILEAAFWAYDVSARLVMLVIAAVMAAGALITARTLRGYGPHTASTLPDAVPEEARP